MWGLQERQTLYCRQVLLTEIQVSQIGKIDVNYYGEIFLLCFLWLILELKLLLELAFNKVKLKNFLSAFYYAFVSAGVH